MNIKTKNTYSWKHKLTAGCLSTLFMLAVFAAIGSFVPWGNGSLTKMLVRKAWFFKEKYLSVTDLGILEEDPAYGWRLIPGSKGRHFVPFGFHVTYTIDEEGNRTTPRAYDLPKVLFLGCSFTMGHGVEDDEPFVSKLAGKWSRYKFINGGVMAWGTTQASKKLEETLGRFNDVKLVVYTAIGHHERRNYPDSAWLDLVATFGKKPPFVDVENGRLVWKGLTDVKNLPPRNAADLASKGSQITRLLLQNMRAACEARGIPFLVVYLPSEESCDLKPDILATVSEDHFLDLRDKVDLSGDNVNGFDSHPNAAGHAAVARLLKPFIEKWLTPVDSSTVTYLGETNSGKPSCKPF